MVIESKPSNSDFTEMGDFIDRLFNKLTFTVHINFCYIDLKISITHAKRGS